jgi:aryl-alcohol dehydrogenase-like predicted oxidoreductase
MHRTTIAGTTIEVSRLVLGTGSLHHLVWWAARRRILDQAADLGITHFDTSPYYGDGLAEADLGRFLQGRRDAFTVATKVGLYPRGPVLRTGVGVWCRRAFGRLRPGSMGPIEEWSVAQARRSLEQSLRRLRTEYVDMLLVHEPNVTGPQADDLLAWMRHEQDRGMLRAFGVAGDQSRIGNLVGGHHPLAWVAQTRDSTTGREADFVIQAGRPLQFTYGYVTADRTTPAPDTIAAALRRNTTGAVIVSSRSPERIAALAERVAS